MKKKLWIAALILPWACLLIWTLSLTVQRSRGTDVTVRVMGYDPRDLLSGRYIAYEIDWDRTDCTQFPQAVCPEKEFCKEARWGRQCRFYVPEKQANQLDALFRKRDAQMLVFEVIYAYQPGHTPIAKQLTINGKDWTEFVN